MKTTVSLLAVSLIPALATSVHAHGADESADVKAVKTVLANYQAAIERLDLRGTADLFTTDSQIFESGGAEGPYANYLAHHLTPELGEFRSFKFSDYKVTVSFEGTVALATETYRYRIEPKSGEPAERMGVATSVLRRVGGQWKIVRMHSSARRPPSQ